MNILQKMKPNRDPKAKAFLYAFIVSLILVWSPSNVLAYLAPIIAITIFIFFSKSNNALFRTILWILAWISATLAYKLLYQDFILQNSAIAFLTYSSFAVFLCIPSKDIRNPAIYQKMFNWIKWFVLIQALLGITQAVFGFSQTGTFDISNGDFVEGTIHPSLHAELSFSNPMFATNMTFMLLAMLPFILVERKGRISFILGIISLVLASVVHVLIFLTISIVASVLLFNPLRIKRRVHSIALLGLLITFVFAATALRSNFSHVFEFAENLISGESYRSLAIRRVAFEMPREYELMPVLGLGPGQFSSRAGLIGTGMFFGGPQNPRPLPIIEPRMTPAFADFTNDLWMEIAERSARGISTGSTHMPFLSWLSIAAEFGVIVLVTFILSSLWVLILIKTRARSYHRRLVAMSLGAGILLLILLGLQENYWEIPQAILLGIMIIKVQYSLLTGKTKFVE